MREKRDFDRNSNTGGPSVNMKSPVSATMALGIVGTFLAFATIVFARATAPNLDFVYIGTYTDSGSEGIYVSRFDPATGRLTSPELAAKIPDASFLAAAPDAHFLYAVDELDHFNGEKTGAVSAFSIDSLTGKLILLNQVSARGAGPAHIALDRTGRFVFVANYTGGSVAVFRLLPGGKIGESTAFDQHYGSSVNQDRQEGPHAHAIAISPDNRFALVADLGLDQIFVYPFDASLGALERPRVVKTDPGSGPRHLTFSKGGKFVYVINELKSSITVYSFGLSNGAMSPLQTVSSLPAMFAGTSTSAEIVLHPSGKFLYASNRGDDSIAAFAVDPAKGTLALIGHVSTGGKTPRSFAIDPSGQWLLAANQNSNSVVAFRINRESGRLTPTGQSVEVKSPAMLDFVPRAGRQ
jgi:6-phosphogluconolactonase